MDFKTWWYGIPVEERPAMAKRLKATDGYLNLIAGGFRQPGESLALRIERESNRAMLVEQLRPDVPWDVIRDRPPVESECLSQDLAHPTPTTMSAQQRAA